MIFHSAPQGSPEWHAARCGVLTASLFSTAIEVSQQNRDGRAKGEPSAASEALSSTLVLERLTQKSFRDIFDSGAMKEGRAQEPRAREWYEETTSTMVQECGIVITEDRRFGYSTDGLVIGTRGAIEVKTLVSPLRIATFVKRPREIVADFIDQIDGGMWLCNLDWVDLIVWIPAFELNHRQATVIRVWRSERRIEQLVERLVAFDKRTSELEELYRSFDPADLAKICSFSEDPVTTVTPKDPTQPVRVVHTTALPSNPFASVRTQQ